VANNWASVELKHLRALRAIAETGTFWAASQQLNSSLSTVSDHIN
jgi:DNA-binding transcriptional LysR family regulator